MLTKTFQETPVFIPAGDNTLLGIFTSPTQDAVEAAVIVLPGGAGAISWGHNRIWVRLCRALAADGYHSLRFDFHGIGESTGIAERFRTDEPFVEDLEGAIRWVQEQGIDQFVLVGLCFGARTALSWSSRIPGLRGMALVSVPVRDMVRAEGAKTPMVLDWSLWEFVRRGIRLTVVRGLFDRYQRQTYGRLVKAKWRDVRGKMQGRLSSSSGAESYWVSPQFLQPLVPLVQRDVPILFIYGTDDPEYEDFRRARSGRLGRLLEHGASRVEVAMIDRDPQGFGRAAVQDAVSDVILDWIRRQRDGVLFKST